jgi:hypothetical protein
MSLVTYEDVRACADENRTGMPRAGVMLPWYVEEHRHPALQRRSVGSDQKPRRSPNGRTPSARGNPATLPPPDLATAARHRRPDLVVRQKAGKRARSQAIPAFTGLIEDPILRSDQEVNDVGLP